MEKKLPICRICLVEDVRMYVVVNKKLHELYEKLTEVPFVTEDRRPMLACFFCCTKLKQCYHFQRKCLAAEELFAQIMNEDYEPEPLINLKHLTFFNGFINSPIVHINIVDGGQTERDTIIEESPDVSERVDYIIDPLKEEELQTLKLEPNNVNNSYPDSEDVPLMEIKSEVDDELESTGAPVSKKPKLDTRRPKPRDTISAEQKKYEFDRKLSSVSKITMKSQNHTSNRTNIFKKPSIKTQQGVCGTINNTRFRNNSNRDNIKRKISFKVINSDKIKRCRRECVHEKPFECDICQCTFIRKKNLVSHTRIHTGEKPFNCDICQRSFNRKDGLVMHTRSHTGEKPFNCDICQRSFNRKDGLVIHTRSHTDEKPFNCDICQRSFIRKDSLVSHTRIHTDEKPFNCDICQRSFNRKNTLRRHTRTHTGEKPFNCDICQRSFNQKKNLLRHILTHTGEKPFNCDICQRSFNRKHSLVRHTLIHTDEKPFNCDICQRSFIRKSSLVRHTRTHTSEKTFNRDTVRLLDQKIGEKVQ